jgi:hypothetical protein
LTAPAKSGRGGKRANAGRPREPDKKEVVAIRMTGEQRLKLAALGGPERIRRFLDETPWPKEKQQ